MPDTHFGFREIPLDDKQALVDDVFHKVARRYDLMNDLMSAGLHRAWKDALVTAINPPRNERDFALLDVAGGTGDVSFRTVAAGGAGTRATVADINAEMLGVGRERAYAQGLDDAVTFVEANAEALPFPQQSFDAVSIAFGIRNVPRIDVALAEMHRVLRLGGRFLCLEFSNVDSDGSRLIVVRATQFLPTGQISESGTLFRPNRLEEIRRVIQSAKERLDAVKK